jgi:hypothetical protein
MPGTDTETRLFVVQQHACDEANSIYLLLNIQPQATSIASVKDAFKGV